MNEVVDRVSVAICNAIRAEHNLPPIVDMETVEGPEHYRKQARAAIQAMLQPVTRIEIIDETGRVYVRDPRVGGPIQVAQTYQDDGKTLKIFVAPRKTEKISAP